MTNHQIALNVVSKAMQVSQKLIVSRCRLGPVVEARHIFILLLAQNGVNDETISWHLNRCRSSITHARHTATNKVRHSSVFQNKYLLVKERYEHQKSLRIS